MPQHSLASAQINDPGCCSSLHYNHSGPPSVQRLSLWLAHCLQAVFPKALYPGHYLLLRLGDIPLHLDSDRAPEGSAMSPLSGPRFPGQGQVFPQLSSQRLDTVSSLHPLYLPLTYGT